jgi:hypothetical protein
VSRTKRRNRALICLLPVIYVFSIIVSSLTPDVAFYPHLVKQMINIFTLPNRIYKLVAPGAWIVLIGGLCSILVFYLIMYRGGYFRGSRIAIALCGLITAAGIFVTAANYYKYQYEYYLNFPIGLSWAAMHSLHPQPARVAYTGTDLNFGLYGPRLKNQVFYVPITRWEISLFHECAAILKKRGQYRVPDTDRIDFCRREPDYVTWIERLYYTRTDLLYVSVLHQNDRPHLAHDPEGFPIEREWADSHPDRFTRIYANPQVKIYSIKK